MQFSVVAQCNIILLYNIDLDIIMSTVVFSLIRCRLQHIKAL